VQLNGFLTLALVCSLAGTSHPAAAQGAAEPADTGIAQFVAGKDYQRIAAGRPTGTDPALVEVAEVFMFGCPGCYGFEPHLQSWLKSKPAYVSFIRIPAPWNAIAEVHARAYYTAELLGKAGEIDQPFFEEFHVKRNTLASEDDLADFFARFGVDRNTFHETFNSPAVDAKLKRAMELVQRYRIPSTPSVVVNGKYLTNGSMAGTYEKWFAIIDALAADEHAAGGTAAN
jgi:protein dithiol oxidoreductase (disulfide-forming)